MISNSGDSFQNRHRKHPYNRNRGSDANIPIKSKQHGAPPFRWALLGLQDYVALAARDLDLPNSCG
jgi:hypothetical protein